jgi:hypothetical protein
MTVELTGEEELEALAEALDGLSVEDYGEGDLGELLEDIDEATGAALRKIAAEQERELSTLKTYLRDRRLVAKSAVYAAREILDRRGLPVSGPLLTRKSAAAPARDRPREDYLACCRRYGIEYCNRRFSR